MAEVPIIVVKLSVRIKICGAKKEDKNRCAYNFHYSTNPITKMFVPDKVTV
jgi:hypothetical protein